MSREPFLQIVENEDLIDGRFSNAVRIDQDGGNGCFSLLFSATDEKVGNKVALKFYDPLKSTDIDRVKRFLREGEMLVKFADEPYVINSIGGVRTITRTFIDQTTKISIPLPLQFIAMEFADSNIDDFIYNLQPNPLVLLKCFKELIKALIRVHKCGICHRDLKPSNFLISSDQIRISDFGTAKCMNGSMPDIRINYFYPVGDVNYIAPENICSIGIDDQYVFRSDMFAMGAILFEMFAYNVLTTEIYTQRNLTQIQQLANVLSLMNEKDKKRTFKGSIDSLAKAIKLPNIYAYNNNVPRCIKRQLNDLYKNLVHINPEKRLYNPTSIHRKIDICILTLENEMKYQLWRKNKRDRKLAMLKKLEELKRRHSIANTN